MGSHNFVSFITVQGFMLGLAFSVLKTHSAEELLTFTALITIFFYLFAHMAVAFYLKTLGVSVQGFPTDVHENDLDLFVTEIAKREDFIDHASDITNDAVLTNKTAATEDKKRELMEKKRASRLNKKNAE